MEHTRSFPWVNFPATSNKLLDGAGFFSSVPQILDSAVDGAFGSPAVNVRLVPRLDMVKEKGLEKLSFYLCGRRGCNPVPCLLNNYYVERMHGK